MAGSRKRVRVGEPIQPSSSAAGTDVSSSSMAAASSSTGTLMTAASSAASCGDQALHLVHQQGEQPQQPEPTTPGLSALLQGTYTYYPGTHLPVEGWFQGCRGCRRRTAFSIRNRTHAEVPACRNCAEQAFREHPDVCALNLPGLHGGSSQQGERLGDIQRIALMVMAVHNSKAAAGTLQTAPTGSSCAALPQAQQQQSQPAVPALAAATTSSTGASCQQYSAIQQHTAWPPQQQQQLQHHSLALRLPSSTTYVCSMGTAPVQQALASSGYNTAVSEPLMCCSGSNHGLMVAMSAAAAAAAAPGQLMAPSGSCDGDMDVSTAVHKQQCVSAPAFAAGAACYYGGCPALRANSSTGSSVSSSMMAAAFHTSAHGTHAQLMHAAGDRQQQANDDTAAIMMVLMS